MEIFIIALVVSDALVKDVSFYQSIEELEGIVL